ncbi:MAG: hypothetical protein ISP90_00085 [Nevskia sp.]|nr:hypothetical protein [Nevskia sp.]
MNRNVVLSVVLAFLVGALTVAIAWRFPELRAKAFWQRQASPGPLSAAHAFLDHQCSACHTPVKGAEATKCIVCHANNTALLQRQATAFHASIGACTQCHAEHQGRVIATAVMDHQKLALIGLHQLEQQGAGSDARLQHHELVAWLDSRDPVAAVAANPHLTPLEGTLDCGSCHATRDRHWGLFGKDCAQCHATTQWSIAEFRHPPPTSMDCAQCHQAPPSHYMEHFKMVSMTVAGQENVQVTQCYRCHQTTAWNDIRSVGLYKHH